MTNKNYAISIGINNYDFNRSLKYASRDADLFLSFLSEKCHFDKTFLFTDNSPKIKGKSTSPSRSNILHVLRTLFPTPILGQEDSFWFFFSGHGTRVNQRDYLIPSDGDPDNAGETAISVSSIIESLRKSGAGNIVLIMDACRSEGADASSKGNGFGSQSQNVGVDVSVVSIFSCTPNQRSYEVEALRQGAFTSALIEILDMGQGDVPRSIRHIDYCLRQKLLETNGKYGKPIQTPYTVVEPSWKSGLLLLPQRASSEEIKAQENLANRVETKGDLSLALCLWEQIVREQYSKEAVDSILRIKSRINARFSEVTNSNDYLNEGKSSKSPINHRKDAPADLDEYQDIGSEKTENYDVKNDSILKEKQTVKTSVEPLRKKVFHEEFSEVNSTKRILIVLLQTSDTGELSLEYTVVSREIHESFLKAKYRENFSIDSHLIAVEAEADFFSSLKKVLADEHFMCLHIMNYDTRNGIVFLDKNGQGSPLNLKSLRGFFKQYDKKIDCVVLDGCYSKLHATSLSNHIDFIIGISNTIGQEAKRQFLVGFYDAIGAGYSIDFSYKIGCNALRLYAGTDTFSYPLIKSRKIPLYGKRVLILSANPVDTSRIRIDEEIREIRSILLKRASKRELFDVEFVLATRIQDLLQAMLEFQPQIVHFSGHGTGENGIILEDESGKSKPISTEALHELFSLFDNITECIVFTGCYSEHQARAIARSIDYVIGMKNAISDRSAIEFSSGFYDAIGAGKPFELAYKLGCESIMSAGLTDSSVPILIQDPYIPTSSEANRPVMIISD